MIILFGAFVLLGIFRILVPVDGKYALGLTVLVSTLPCLMFEIIMLQKILRVIKTSRMLSHTLARMQLIIECAFPLGLMYALMLIVPELRYTVLLSPGYALMMVLISVSILRVDRLATLMTGLF